ncbi:hypothetical protein Bca4012_089511 [Brassica carinata]
MVKAQVEVKGKARRGRPPKNINVSEVANGRQAGQRRQQIRRSKRDKLPQQGKLSTSSKTCN